VIIPIFSFGKKNQIPPINPTRLKDVKELVYGGFGRITKEVWAKAEDRVLEIEKEYGKENCIDRSEIPPIIIDFDDDQSSDEES
jgi:hypothetical protein